MASSQYRAHKPSLAHRFGFELGNAVKRFRVAWFRMENNLIQRAGERGKMLRACLLVLKVMMGVAGVAALLLAAFWIAAAIIGLFVLVTFGSRGRQQDQSFFDDGFNTAWNPWDFWKS
ncbi:hypothetical protein OU800_22155 [Pseudomonas sp. GOM7]|uniref:hypothetical protein n=1 Tax=Pseudomonas sp. GOM7 TaxID=2998079 RepID=UPI00227CD28F|nr:hypothetical protein [Pseudomonas sp. GOM7]WAJ37279.1 hypothetical protein OU800_22155 [Pseudomonas sp. GOM7]